MEVTKVFFSGKSQAVRLPKKFRFNGNDEVCIQRLGRTVILYPKEDSWTTFINGLNDFSEDIFPEKDKEE